MARKNPFQKQRYYNRPWSQLSPKEKLEKILTFWRMAVPAAFTIIYLPLMSLPLDIDGIMLPNLVFLSVYYWSCYQPSLMPFWLAFLLGLMVDFVMVTPAGLHGLALMISAWLLSRQAPYFKSRPFQILWLVCTMAFTLYQTIIYFAIRNLVGDVAQAEAFVIQGVLTILVFPLLAWFHGLLVHHVITN